MLELQGIVVSYGKVEVLRGLDLHIGDGEIVALLGPNGSGKSTTVKAVAGLVTPRGGTIRYGGESIDHASVKDRVTRGITLVNQGRTLFNSMSVEENLLLGAFTRKDHREIAAEREMWLQFFPGLEAARRRPAGQLSGGQQRMVAVARGMMAKPSLLMLDEPSLGVAPNVLIDLAVGLRRIRDDHGVSIILVEQDIPFALDVADRVLVLAGGHIALTGTPDELRDGERLRAVYFGEQVPS